MNDSLKITSFAEESLQREVSRRRNIPRLNQWSLSSRVNRLSTRDIISIQFKDVSTNYCSITLNYFEFLIENCELPKREYFQPKITCF